MKKILLLLFCTACLATGCFSIRTDYQPTVFYRLVQKPSAIRAVDTLPGTLYIRTFTANEEFNNDHLVFLKSHTEVDFYTYHRWISETPELVTDFVTNRYINGNMFRKGIVGSGSALVPNYILEGKILQMVADNGDSNNVLLELQITVIGIEPMQAERPVILQKVYSKTVARNNNTAASIPDAFSDALSTISDELLVDLEKAIRYHNANTPKGATVQSNQ